MGGGRAAPLLRVVLFIRSSRLLLEALDALPLLCAVFGEPTHGAAPRVVPQPSLASVPSSRSSRKN